MSKRHSAGRVTYPGNCSHIVGEIKSPTTYGSAVLAVTADWDPATDQTVVHFVHCHEDDLKAAVRDEFGQLRLPTLVEAAS